jgi:AAA ATPase domain
LIGHDPARVQVISGLPGVGKSTLLHSALRTPDTPPVGFLEPTPAPDLYVPVAWLDLMASLFESARHKGQVKPVMAFPERELALAPDADAAAFEAGFQHLRDRLDGPTGAGRPVLVIDPVEALFPLEDPLAEDAHRADGADAMLEALVNLAERGEASLVLVTRDVGGTYGRAIDGHPLSLPDATDELVVGLLGAESCQTALDRLLHDLGATVETDALELLADAAGGHPLVMWTLVDEITRWCSPGAEALDTDRAGTILDRVLQRTPFQRFAQRLFAELDPGARQVLRALATAEAGVLDAAAIAEALSASGDAAATESVLDALTRTTLVAPRQSEGYQLRIGLLRRYLAELPPFP